MADSLISNLDGKVDEGVQAAWEVEIAKHIDEMDSGKAELISKEEFRRRRQTRLRDGRL